MEAFEFEYKGKRYRFCSDGTTTSQSHDGKQWWEQVQIVGVAKAGVDALLSRVTALEAELAAAKADYQREHDYITVVVSERDNLRAENDALREKLAGAKHV